MEKEFPGFPNELRLHGPEECVGILIKHQSYDGNDWNCFLDHRRRGESPRTSAGPVSTRIRLDPSPRTCALFRFPRSILRLSSADNKLHSDAMSSAHWFSRHVLRCFVPLQFASLCSVFMLILQVPIISCMFTAASFSATNFNFYMSIRSMSSHDCSISSKKGIVFLFCLLFCKCYVFIS